MISPVTLSFTYCIVVAHLKSKLKVIVVLNLYDSVLLC